MLHVAATPSTIATFVAHTPTNQGVVVDDIVIVPHLYRTGLRKRRRVEEAYPVSKCQSEQPTTTTAELTSPDRDGRDVHHL